MSLSDTGFAVFQKFSRCDVAIKRHDSIFPEMSDPGLRSVVACTETWSGQNIIVRHAHNTVEILFCLSHFNFFLFTSTNENVRLSRYIYIWTHSHFFFPFLCCSALRKIVFRLDFRNCDIPRKLEYRAKLLFFSVLKRRFIVHFRIFDAISESQLILILMGKIDWNFCWSKILIEYSNP